MRPLYQFELLRTVNKRPHWGHESKNVMVSKLSLIQARKYDSAEIRHVLEISSPFSA